MNIDMFVSMNSSLTPVRNLFGSLLKTS